jgi:predicted amidophosphoribosyltransferase
MRQTNIKGAFAANLRIDLRGRTVLIVDDVATTGATLSECARVLRGAGAQRVDGWTIARGL